MEDMTAISIENLKKKYRLGTIGGTTLNAELQSWWAKKRGLVDPNSEIGKEAISGNEEFWALNGINLEVLQGEALGIIGSNGAGKSTLLKILSRVTAPTAGDIWMKGRVSSMLEVGTGFHPELTGRENIYMNGAILGMPRTEINEKLDEIIDFSECGQFIDTPVKRYSSGMYVKLAFSVAAHLDAEIMIMDEVLAVGDMKFQKKCLGKMGDEASNKGKTVLYVSHNMNTIRQLCTRCIVLNKGMVVYDGEVEKAIDIYMDQQSGDLKSYHDFNNVARPSIEHGSKLFVNSFEFLNKKNAIFMNTEKMLFRIRWVSKDFLPDLRIYLAIQYADDTPVGMAQSKVFANGRPGEYGTCEFSFDISNLVEGTYFFYVDVFSMNEFSSHESYDHPMEKVFFEIIKDENIESINWIRRAWGSIRLSELEIVQ